MVSCEELDTIKERMEDIDFISGIDRRGPISAETITYLIWGQY